MQTSVRGTFCYGVWYRQVSHNGSQADTIVFPIVDVTVTLMANRYLFTIKRRQVEAEATKRLPPFADMPNMVHLHLFGAAANGTAIEQTRLCVARPPSRERVHLCQSARLTHRGF